mmetsp:Transcript_31067/g.43042  ORF Transcript_31067/g.43042 Transcript_31067/m.43042 type:complete len:405 (+) Transcript_31067:102-1316(+)|eukprot:CAMPEP_0196576006 /NCGR_PEP_ID=MMETSP1081-20130531/5378_1 /TAXON_ID=36882 /ORGANISM="Pyramimonas amylifera, Strain CCMP720" /LENGTH=404 /DNA_ID=CAMNT_0041894487 /DNA_START=69 /DNA_END=1283 /DNA_ORIENTATION=-
MASKCVAPSQVFAVRSFHENATTSQKSALGNVSKTQTLRSASGLKWSAKGVSSSKELMMSGKKLGGACSRGSLRCASDASPAGTALKSTSIMVIGATGTVGRQVVRRALDEGYDVRCLVRPRQNPADFLRDWGAVTVKGDLTKPESLPPSLVGIHTIIDCATARPEESIQEVDWEGKMALIQAAKAMGIQRYVFFSVEGCDKHPEVPLMDMKRCTEQYLEQIGMPYTVLRNCGFMQALISQYAVPILEEQSVWGTSDTTRTAYLDTQDVARMTLACLRSDETVNKTYTLAGPKAYTIQEVIAMCEKKAGNNAQVTEVPLAGLKALQFITSLFQWTRDASDRLAFANLLTNNEVISAPMDDTYKAFGMDESETTTLEAYFDDYFSRILKKLKEVGGASKQRDFYL